MIRRYRAAALLPAVLLANLGPVTVAAEPTGDESMLFLQALDQRVAEVSWRLASANSALCSAHMNAIGFSVHDAAQYAPAYRRAAIDTFGFGDGLPAVLAAAKGAPAAAAGVRPGDRIVAIDGKRVSPGTMSNTSKEDYASVSAVTTRLEDLPAGRPVALEILRGQTPMTMTVRPATVCRSRVEVVPSSQINANSNGQTVQIYGKLALWTKTDDELAIIVAHEMAHNILDHNRRIERERIGTGIFASLGRDGRKMRDMEREADRYGLYLAARAGYDYRVAPDLWRRLSNASGLGGIWATTHPTAGNRAEFNQGVVAEIASKAAQPDLVP